jgi:hypothetical protein
MGTPETSLSGGVGSFDFAAQAGSEKSGMAPQDSGGSGRALSPKQFKNLTGGAGPGAATTSTAAAEGVASGAAAGAAEGAAAGGGLEALAALLL